MVCVAVTGGCVSGGFCVFRVLYAHSRCFCFRAFAALFFWGGAFFWGCVFVVSFVGVWFFSFGFRVLGVTDVGNGNGETFFGMPLRASADF